MLFKRKYKYWEDMSFMIDYDKLKLAHELMLESRKIAQKEFLKIGAKIEQATVDYIFKITDYDGMINYIDLDDLIKKLQELTQDKPKPKYEVGQEVWGGYKNPLQFWVVSWDGKEYLVKDKIKQWSSSFSENELYPSKHALIEVQLRYWAELYVEQNPGTEIISHRPRTNKRYMQADIQSNQVQPDINGCQHDVDGAPRYRKGNQGVFAKCKKCFVEMWDVSATRRDDNGMLVDSYYPEENEVVSGVHRHRWDGKFYHAFTKEPCDMRNTMHFVCKCADCGEWYT